MGMGKELVEDVDNVYDHTKRDVKKVVHKVERKVESKVLSEHDKHGSTTVVREVVREKRVRAPRCSKGHGEMVHTTDFNEVKWTFGSPIFNCTSCNDFK